MIQLYYDPACPFCRRVLNVFEAENVEFEHKEMSLWAHSEVRSELVELSGRTQVPFLVDQARAVKMPESADIIDYVREHYSSTGN